MDMQQWVLDIYRTITAFLLLVGLTLCIHNRLRYARFWNHQEKLFIRATIYLAFAPFVGVIWNVSHHAAFNLGLPFVTVGAVCLIYASLTKPERLESAEAYLEMQEKRLNEPQSD